MKRFKDYVREGKDDREGWNMLNVFDMLDDLAQKVESLEYNMSTHEEITGGLLGDVEELERRLDTDPEAESQEIMKSTID